MFKKYKIEKISDTLYCVKRRKFPCKWVTIETYSNKHQAECALHRIKKDIKSDILFTHYCSVKPTNKDHVIYNLKKMGYIPSLTFDFEAKYWYTSQSGFIYSTNNDNVARLIPNVYDNLYGIYCCDKDDIFLAIAAIYSCKRNPDGGISHEMLLNFLFNSVDDMWNDYKKILDISYDPLLDKKEYKR